MTTELTAIGVEHVDGILVVRLDRPQTRNAIDEHMRDDLDRLLEQAAAAADVRAVVLTGAGEAFCSGADLARFGRGDDGAAFRLESQRLTALLELVERIEKPVIAAINGPAAGFGMQLALACDLRVAAEAARFVIADGRLGLIASHGGVARLVKLVGLARARDILLSSRDVTATRAHELGLVTEIVAAESLLPAALALARDAMRRAPQSYGLTKRLLLLAASADLSSGLAAEAIAQSLLRSTADHQEGLRAAAERRPPQLAGR
jgi:enoyl-CoA hydratase/carnithine racemase